MNKDMGIAFLLDYTTFKKEYRANLIENLYKPEY